MAFGDRVSYVAVASVGLCVNQAGLQLVVILLLSTPAAFRRHWGREMFSETLSGTQREERDKGKGSLELGQTLEERRTSGCWWVSEGPWTWVGLRTRIQELHFRVPSRTYRGFSTDF